jgi:hypothetical protein
MWKSISIAAKFSQVSPVLITHENKELKIYAIKFISCRPSHNIEEGRQAEEPVTVALYEAS